MTEILVVFVSTLVAFLAPASIIYFAAYFSATKWLSQESSTRNYLYTGYGKVTLAFVSIMVTVVLIYVLLINSGIQC